MRIVARCFVVLVLTGLQWPAQAAAGRVLEDQNGDLITIVAGQTKVMEFYNIRRISVGNDDIADVLVLRDVNQILITAKALGLTDLRVWTRDGGQFDYVLRVILEKPDRRVGEVRDLLSSIEGIELREIGDELVMEGQALTEDDFRKLQAIARKYGITNFVTSALITPRATIVMDVKVLEIRKSRIKDLGIRWDASANGPAFGYFADWRTNPQIRVGGPVGPPLSGANAATYFGISTALGSQLDFLVSKGFARFLAEPTLTCRSGGSASFLAGGEVPIPIDQGNGAISVEFKQYGIILNMSPIADPSGYIQTTVEVEVSSIDPSVSVMGVPGFLTRKTATEMNLRSGDTMVLSGLLSDNATKDLDKLPGLGNIPILGELFKSRSFRREETELIVLVTPGLLTVESERNQNAIERATEIKSIARSDLGNLSEADLRFSIKD